MTCWSCEHYRAAGCADEQPGWPATGDRCPFFIYCPGSDEGERQHGERD